MRFLAARIDYERAAAERLTTRDFKLDRMRELLARLDDPQETIPAVHIAGTKGKGSTAVMTAEILAASGYRTGLFTSPHIAAFEERMRVDGRSPDRDVCVELLNEVAGVVVQMDVESPAMQPTYFEIATAMAWLDFRRERCDFAVLEVGLGGRLDSTNLCRPEATVLTNVGLDHTNILGKSISKIAREKAGIIKPHVPVVSGVMHPEARRIVQQTAFEHQADLLQSGEEIVFEHHAGGDDRRPATVDVVLPFSRYDAVPLTLVGRHQGANAALAVATADLLDRRGYHVPREAVFAGMTNVRWPLRFERIGDSPAFVVDAAHNADSALAVVDTLNAEYPGRRKTLIFAASRDKDVERLAEILFPHFDGVILTSFLGNPRSVPPDELQARTAGRSRFAPRLAADPRAAVNLALCDSSPDDVVCATGSFYLAAEVRGVLTANDAGIESPGVAVRNTAPKGG